MTSSATQTDRSRRKARLGSALVGGVMVLAGWIILLMVNRWYFTAPVFFLFAAWLGLVMTAWFLSQAGWTASDEEEDQAFWRPAGRTDELERQKRALLKAIKEIEFDHQLGKMSDEDAEELTRFYRGRAIEVIKLLEGGEGPATTTADEIDRDLKARIAVAGAIKATSKKTGGAAAKVRAAAESSDEERP